MTAPSEETYRPTANQQYAISYCGLITTAVLLIVCEILSRIQVGNRHFRPLYSDCEPLAEERLAMST